MTSSRTKDGRVLKKKTPIIELARQDYQPTKAEREEKVALRRADGSAPGQAEVMRALTRPVEITYLEKPQEVRPFTIFLALCPHGWRRRWFLAARWTIFG